MRAKSLLGVLAAFLLVLSIGCSQNSTTTADVKGHVSQALNNAGYKDISVAVNNDKELVTLTGNVKSQDDKDQVEKLAKQNAADFVVSDEIGIRPEGVESQARNIDKNVDTAIEKDFKAVLIANRMDNQHIKFSAKNGVLTLQGKVDGAQTREKAEQLAAGVPNVQQVVNELDVKNNRTQTRENPGS